jgi:C1A family cysteine protease
MYKFTRFIKQHDKEYSTMEEFHERFAIFKDNLSRVDDHETFSPFMDITPEDFQLMLTLSAESMPQSSSDMETYVPTIGALPESIDWRTLGAVAPVRNQGSCGSCWAFSTCSNLEGQYQIKKGTLVNLSEQELLDCDTYDYACNGGWMDNAFKWLITKGIMLEIDYPYTARKGTCKYSASKVLFKTTGSLAVSKNEDDIAKALVERGPLAIAVDASRWQYYTKGIMTAATCRYLQLNHGVNLVGYGVEGTNKFWIIRNSWGPNWGENGYLRVIRGTGTCGMNTAVSTGTIA